MAAQDPTKAESQDAAAWDGADLGFVADDLTCLTDGNTSTTCVKQGKDPDDVERLEYASLKNKDANGTITVHFPGDHQYTTMALLPYDGATTVDTTEKLTYAISSGTPAVFTLPQSFLDKLHDLGSGKGAVRIVEDGEIAGDISIAEVDADFTEAVGETRSLAGAQPAATGTLVRVYQAKRTVVGAQPSATGVLTRIYKALRTLAGAQPAATGTLVRSHGRKRTLTGNQPAGSGTIAAVLGILRTLTGIQPAATGTLTRILKAKRTVVGSQPSATGTLVRRLKALRTLVGAQPAGTGSLVRRLKALRTLVGSQPAGTADLLRGLDARRTLSGNQPAAAGTLAALLIVLPPLTQAGLATAKGDPDLETGRAAIDPPPKRGWAE